MAGLCVLGLKIVGCVIFCLKWKLFGYFIVERNVLAVLQLEK